MDEGEKAWEDRYEAYKDFTDAQRPFTSLMRPSPRCDKRTHADSSGFFFNFCGGFGRHVGFIIDDWPPYPRGPNNGGTFQRCAMNDFL